MNNLFQLAEMPTQIGDVHDAGLRSHHILSLVQELLQKHTPHDVVLGIIEQAKGLSPVRIPGNGNGEAPLFGFGDPRSFEGNGRVIEEKGL